MKPLYNFTSKYADMRLSIQLAGDSQEARSLLKQSLQQSEKIDMKEGIHHAREAIQQLDSGVPEIKPYATVAPEV